MFVFFPSMDDFKFLTCKYVSMFFKKLLARHSVVKNDYTSDLIPHGMFRLGYDDFTSRSRLYCVFLVFTCSAHSLRLAKQGSSS